jgi:hypothetical protein
MILLAAAFDVANGQLSHEAFMEQIHPTWLPRKDWHWHG